MFVNILDQRMGKTQKDQNTSLWLRMISTSGQMHSDGMSKLVQYFLARSAKVAERAICFTDRNFFFILLIFFNDFSETNYLKIRWTDFRNLYVE